MNKPKLLFVQTGNFASAYHHFEHGGSETYRDQRTSVQYVAELAARYDVTTLSRGSAPHDEILAPDLRSIEATPDQFNSKSIAVVLASLEPDLIVLRSPFYPVASWAKTNAISILPCFADLFERRGLRELLRLRRLSAVLSGKNVPCIANHSLNASKSVVTTLGWSTDKVVPWDWARLEPNATTKAQCADPESPTLFYAGAMSIEKGLGDCLEAVKILRSRGIAAKLSIAGGGDRDIWVDKAKSLGIDDAVTFLGLIPNTAVRDQMAQHDIIVVPSRPSYPEGLPNTIYEALASRSALLLSNHPAFVGRIKPDEGAVFFEAGQQRDLADAVGRLAQNAALYANLSRCAPDTLEELYVGMEWPSLVDAFLADPSGQSGWVAQNALSSLDP